MAFQRAFGPSLALRLFSPGSPRMLHLLRAAWPSAVGRELARRTEILALVNGVLRVRVEDSRWRKAIQRMEPQILSHLWGRAGPQALRRLGFEEGGVPIAPGEPERRESSTYRASAELKAAASQIRDPELREGFLETASRYLARSGSGDPQGAPQRPASGSYA